jgi:hypothetical protein
MKIGYIRQDNNAHNFLVPEGEVDAFEDGATKINEARTERDRFAAEDEFTTKFWKYRISGVSDLKVIMEE